MQIFIKSVSLVLVIVALFFSCSTPVKITENNYHILKAPPGTARISDNFYCDKTEVGNIDYREFLYWTQVTFGENSTEYLATLPDTIVWTKDYPCIEPLTDGYFRFPGYNNYPVVGITQVQANLYSKWRSDRVFEMMLIKMKKIKSQIFNSNKHNYFTIEKYFKGTFKGILPGEKVKFYPNYHLPTQTERLHILNFADSINNKYFENCNSKYCKDCKLVFSKYNSDNDPFIKDSCKYAPTNNIFSGCSARNDYAIYNLKGNVSEWSHYANIAYGGNWHNKNGTIKDTFQVNSQNAWTGFRNVAEWKEWK